MGITTSTVNRHYFSNNNNSSSSSSNNNNKKIATGVSLLSTVEEEEDMNHIVVVGNCFNAPMVTTSSTSTSTSTTSSSSKRTHFFEDPFALTFDKVDSSKLIIQIERCRIDQIPTVDKRLEHSDRSRTAAIPPILAYYTSDRSKLPQGLFVLSIVYSFQGFGSVTKVCSDGCSVLFLLTSDMRMFALNFAIRDHVIAVDNPPYHHHHQDHRLPNSPYVSTPVLSRILSGKRVRDFCISRDNLIVCRPDGTLWRFPRDPRYSSAIHVQNRSGRFFGIENRIVSVYSKSASNFILAIDVHGLAWLWNDEQQQQYNPSAVHRVTRISDRVIRVLSVMDQFIILDKSGQLYFIVPNAILFIGKRYSDVYPITAQTINIRTIPPPPSSLPSDLAQCGISEVKKCGSDIIVTRFDGISLILRYYREMNYWMEPLRQSSTGSLSSLSSSTTTTNIITTSVLSHSVTAVHHLPDHQHPSIQQQPQQQFCSETPYIASSFDLGLSIVDEKNRMVIN